MNFNIGKLSIPSWSILIAVTPMFYWMDQDLSGQAMRTQQLLCFLMVVGIMLSSVINNKHVGAFLFWSLMGSFWSKSPTFIPTTINLTAGFLAYHLIYESEKVSFKAASLILTVILSLNIILALMQLQGCDFLFFQNYGAGGFLNLPAYVGMYSVMAVPFLFNSNIYLVIIPLIGIYLSKSSACALAFLAQIILFLSTFIKISRLVIVLTISAFFIYAFADSQTGQWGRRFNVWRMVASHAIRNPWLGFGSGGYDRIKFIEFGQGSRTWFFSVVDKPDNETAFKNKILSISRDCNISTSRLESVHFMERGSPFSNLKSVFDELRGTPNGPQGYLWDHPHNEYLLIFFNYGFPGVIILGFYLCDLFLRYGKIKNKDHELQALMASAIAILCFSFLHFPLHLARLSSLIIFVFARLDKKTFHMARMNQPSTASS